MMRNVCLEIGTSDGYRLEHKDDCILVFGSVPVREFADLAKRIRGTKSDPVVFCPYVAHLAHANFAFGQKSKLKALEKRLREEFDFAGFFRSLGKTVEEATPGDYWLAVGEQGASSCAIYAAMHEGTRFYQDWGVAVQWPHPRDPDDLRRCLLFLRQVDGDAQVMAGKSPAWDALLARWSELVDTFAAEVPPKGWEEGEGLARKTYQLMQEILEGA